VPAGIKDGQVIRVPGEGEPGEQGGPRGDLHVVVRVQGHDLFNRDGDNLVLPMPISFSQAALGDTVEVPTLEGTTELDIPRGTQHGATFRIRNEGMPNLRTGRPGDLIVQVLIEIPKKLTKRQEELLLEFAETEDHQVMPHSKGFFEKLRAYIAGD
jgi:molecular chaperone DnaJ